MNKTANRWGAEIGLYDYSDGSLKFYVDFANSVAIETASNRVFATGGENAARQVGFDDPMEGTLKISTQIVPIEFIALACSPNGVETGAEIAKKEKLTLTSGKLTLTETPVAGSVYAYAPGTSAGDTPATITVSNKEVTVTGGTDGDVYTVYYIFESATAKSVTFSNKVSAGTYKIIGKTQWKDTNDVVSTEQFTCHKAMPQKAFSITYQGSGDPLIFEMTFDLMEDEDGNCYTPVRI